MKNYSFYSLTKTRLGLIFVLIKYALLLVIGGIIIQGGLVVVLLYIGKFFGIIGGIAIFLSSTSLFTDNDPFDKSEPISMSDWGIALENFIYNFCHFHIFITLFICLIAGFAYSIGIMPVEMESKTASDFWGNHYSGIWLAIASSITAFTLRKMRPNRRQPTE